MANQPYLRPQAALETALLNLLQAPKTAGGLEIPKLFCGRSHDGKPPPLHRGRWYAAVHSDGAKQSGGNGAQATAQDAKLGVWVTVTVELVLPFDRWTEHRDDLEAKCDAVVAAVHADVYGNVIVNAANLLAGRRRADSADEPRPVGLFRGLAWEGTDGLVEQQADWLSADPTSGKSAFSQRVRFGGACLIQDLSDME